LLRSVHYALPGMPVDSPWRSREVKMVAPRPSLGGAESLGCDQRGRVCEAADAYSRQSDDDGVQKSEHSHENLQLECLLLGF
jgi:hypothetical protein